MIIKYYLKCLKGIPDEGDDVPSSGGSAGGSGTALSESNVVYISTDHAVANFKENGIDGKVVVMNGMLFCITVF